MRLIKVADVCEILADMYPADGETVISYKEIDRAYTKVQCLPTVDAAPVKHGRWLSDEEDIALGMEAHCSECCCSVVNKRYHYCPNCGAKMDLEDEQ